MKRFKYIFIVISVVLIITAVHYVWASRPSTDTIFVESATMVSTDPMELLNQNRSLEFMSRWRNCMVILWGGHQIKKGDNMVFQYQYDSPGSPHAIDDETFKTLTVEMNKELLGRRVSINSPNVRFYYSRGSSVWDHLCGGSYASDATGTVMFERLGSNELKATLDVEFQLVSAQGDDDKETEVVKRTFTAKNLHMPGNSSKWVRVFYDLD